LWRAEEERHRGPGVDWQMPGGDHHGMSRAAVRSPTLSLTPGSGSRPNRLVTSLRTEVVSYEVLSMYPRLANGEMISAGMRVAGPQRSPQPCPVGGGT